MLSVFTSKAVKQYALQQIQKTHIHVFVLYCTAGNFYELLKIEFLQIVDHTYVHT